MIWYQKLQRKTHLEPVFGKKNPENFDLKISILRPEMIFKGVAAFLAASYLSITFQN